MSTVPSMAAMSVGHAGRAKKRVAMVEGVISWIWHWVNEPGSLLPTTQTRPTLAVTCSGTKELP
jgi:hypothetical protein